MFYSKSTEGFYDPKIHKNIPVDAVAITKEKYAELMLGQSQNQIITSDEQGQPILLPVVLTLTQKCDSLEAAVKRNLDSVAKEYGYDNIFSAVTYAEETAVNKYRIEGLAFRRWRSKTWDSFYALRASILEGQRSIMDEEILLAELPAFKDEL